MNNLGIFSIYLIILNTFSLAQVHITTDTEWTSDQVLTGAVIVDAGATLTIAAGVQVQTFFVDTDADNIGDVEIEVLGGLKINGTPSNPVLFKPYETTTNKNYWTGIVIYSSISNDSLNFFKVYNANTGIDISSPITITGGTVRNSGGTGINVNTISNGDVSLNDITVKHSDDNGIVVNSPNVTLNWVFVDSCDGVGLFNKQNGILTVTNMVVTNCNLDGIFNYDGNITLNNCYIEDNGRFGLVNSSGDAIIQYCDLKDNAASGLIIGGTGTTTTSFSSFTGNGGTGVDITGWKLDFTNLVFTSEGDPSVSVNNSNLTSNYSSLSNQMYNYATDWSLYYYSPQGSIWDMEDGPFKLPFGILTYVEFDGYRFTGSNSEPHYGFKNTDDTWSIDFVNDGSHNQWMSFSSNTYYLGDDIFIYAYASGATPNNFDMTNVEIGLKVGNFEVFSKSGASATDFTQNYWGTLSNIADRIYYTSSPIDYSNFQVFEVADAHSTVDETDAIALTSPVAAASYETATSVAVIWTSSGWVPLVNIAISTDLGSTWSYLAEDIANTGSYSWWNDLAVGTTVYLKIEDSYDSSVSGQVGPFFIIENGDPPVADAQTVITDEDIPVSITLSGTDADGDDLTYSVITNPTIGTLSGTAPNLTYTPNTDVYGSDSLTFKVNDGTFDSDPAAVSIIINSTNDGPSISLPDDFTFEEDGNLVVNFTPYVGDVDGDPLTLSVTDNTEVLVEIIDFEVTFGATDNWNGTETLIFTVDDSQGRAVAAASVDVIVISVNDEPTANAGTDSTYESPYPYDPADVTLDGNGSNDIDGNIVSYIWTESGTQVADIVSPTLTLALGDYTFTLTVTDNEGSTNSDNVVIYVIEELNTPPTATSATVVTDEDTPVSITLTGTDLEGDALLYTVETNPSNGTLSGDPPNLTYTPNTNYYGSDNFTFTVNDGVVDSDPATITITVEQINDPPVVSEIQDQEIDEDNSTGNIQFTVSDIDTDLEFIILSASSSNNALVPHDNIVIEGTGENRTISVSPAPNQNGTTIITVVADDVPPPVVLTITIVPDNYPNETSWELFDSDNTYIDGISPNILTTPYEVYTWDIELSAGYYTFTIYDSYGDGLTGQGSGWYTLYIGDVEIVSGATFNYSESTTFSTNTSLFRIERVSYLNREPFNRGFDILSIENIEEYIGDPVVVHNQTIPINSRETTSVSFSLLVNPVNDAPSSFVLEQPENNTQIVITNDNMSETLIFNWGVSTDIDGDELYYTIEGTDGLSFLSIDNLENNSLEWNYDELVNTIGFEPTVSGTWMVVSSDGELISEATNGPFNLTIDISEILTIDENLIPENFSLHQNHPNPFNPITTLQYDLPEDAMVNITIYDMMGRIVSNLVSSQQNAGYKSIQWDATNNVGQPVSAGLYLYTIQAGKFRQTKKMVLLK
jgi:hypothetical protein